MYVALKKHIEDLRQKIADKIQSIPEIKDIL